MCDKNNLGTANIHEKNCGKIIIIIIIIINLVFNVCFETLINAFAFGPKKWHENMEKRYKLITKMAKIWEMTKSMKSQCQ
jgi:hypothetical protein